MTQSKDVTGTYGSAPAPASTGTYNSDSDKTFTYSEAHETISRSNTHGIGVGDKITLRERHFTVTEIISEGTGEAVIYKVADDDQKTFALKLYFEFRNAKEEPNGETLRRIKEIEDPDILRLYDYGVGLEKYQNKYCFEISEFAEGGDLFSVEDIRSHYSLEHIEKVVIPEIFRGIQKLHSYKIYHCDLKPWNLLYLDKARTNLVIGDYGSGKAFDLEAEKEARKTSTLKGTETYISPEQSRGIVSEKNDYYSFGMILLHLLYPDRIGNDSDLRRIDKTKFERIVERQNSSLPVIDYDPQYLRLNSLIAGLTLLIHYNRWSETEVERWLAGEEVEVRYKTTKSDNIQPIKLGYTTIRNSDDFIKVMETEAAAYNDLIEDPDTYTTVKAWLDSYRDIPTRKSFDNMVRFYQPFGKDYVREATLRFFEPKRTAVIDMHTFDFFHTADLGKEVDTFIRKMDEIWKITAGRGDKQEGINTLRFYLFQLELSLRLIQTNSETRAAVNAGALLEKIYVAFGIAPQPFENLSTQIAAKLNPRNEEESFRQLLDLFYTFDLNRGFRYLKNGSIKTLEELGLFFARDGSACENKYLIAEKKRFLQSLKKSRLADLDQVAFIFEVFKDWTTTELGLESLTFDKQHQFHVNYNFSKTLNPYLSGKGIREDYTLSSSSEVFTVKRKFLQSFSSICSAFLTSVQLEKGISTLSAQNLENVRSKFLWDSWLRYLHLYKKNIAVISAITLGTLFIIIISYGISTKKLHADALLGITWMDNGDYLRAYNAEAAKAAERAKLQFIQSFVGNLNPKQVRFFSAGSSFKSTHKRSYQSTFNAGSIKLLYVEFTFDHPTPSYKINFEIKCSLFFNGQKIDESTYQSYVESGWSNSNHWLNFGERNWKKGIYTIETRINNRLANTQNFSVN